MNKEDELELIAYHKRIDKNNPKVEKADCGHYELERLMTRQLGKLNCRNCTRKVNARMTRIVIIAGQGG